MVIGVILYSFQIEQRQSLTTNTYSSEFDSDEKKIAFLRKYLAFPSEVEATEFHIIYHDNSSGLPGPSDYSIVAVIKIEPTHVNDWVKNMRPRSEKIDLAWGFNLLPNSDVKWKVISPPQIYTSLDGNSMTVVFQTEGIIFKRIQTN